MLLIDFVWFVLSHVGRIICDIFIVILSPLIFLYYGYTRNSFTKSKKFKSILITGGSSGIGKAIAKEFVLRNISSSISTTIIITGRNERRLNTTVKELNNLINKLNGKESCNILSKIIDVCDKDGMKEYIKTIDDKYNLDLVIANAGINSHMLKNPHYFESAEKVLDVNCQGVLNTILPIIPRFQDRKSGHIAVTGSLSAFLPLCMNNHYAATKAYVRFLCDDLRPKLKLIGNIDVTYIAPGYVRSRMATEKVVKDRIGYMTEEPAAKIIVNGLQSNHGFIGFPDKVFSLTFLINSIHPILNVLINDRIVTRDVAVQHVGFYHEIDPNDEFGGEC